MRLVRDWGMYLVIDVDREGGTGIFVLGIYPGPGNVHGHRHQLAQGDIYFSLPYPKLVATKRMSLKCKRYNQHINFIELMSHSQESCCTNVPGAKLGHVIPYNIPWFERR